MRNKSVVTEACQIQVAVELIELGARLQLLQEETALSRERLLKLYKEVKGVSPSKGMLPYSTDWFMSWSPNIHSSGRTPSPSRERGARSRFAEFTLYPHA